MNNWFINVDVDVNRAVALSSSNKETLWPISTGKCAGKSSVTRTSTRGNTLLPSTLTLLIGLRVTHSWGCVYVCVSARANTYTRKHERTRHTPSYLPSYTRLGHAIPGSKTVSVGRRKGIFSFLLSYTNLFHLTGNTTLYDTLYHKPAFGLIIYTYLIIALRALLPFLHLYSVYIG